MLYTHPRALQPHARDLLGRSSIATIKGTVHSAAVHTVYMYAEGTQYTTVLRVLYIVHRYGSSEVPYGTSKVPNSTFEGTFGGTLRYF